ncbi:MAG: DeoR/GlpR family DNA-binding transcription regulator [Clostridiales bacterium]|nr:DeoR/GlpR family DNA-binding transcription regulator [Clostridiales bacterium]
MQKIAELVKCHQKITTRELAERMGVSEMTIRRDLTVLHKNRVIEKKHGYAVLEHDLDPDITDMEAYDLHLASIQNLKAKEKIVCYAASLIEPGDWIFMDNGTTISRITAFLPTSFEYTVLCCNFELMAGMLKYKNIQMIMPGGYYHPVDHTFSSPQAENFICCHRANKAFISASGIHRTLGITCINFHSVANKKCFLSSSEKRILLADSSKFDVVTSNHFAELGDIDMVITDAGISSDWREYLQQMDVELKIL